MDFQDYWDAYTASERDLFQRTCRKLLKTTFIVRDKNEESRKAYFFVAKLPEPFSLYLGFIGFDVLVDRDNGVIMLRNCADAGEYGRLQANRLALRKYQSVVLCCLWTMYADRIKAGSLAQNITVALTELNFELEKFGARDLIDKKPLAESLALFEKFNLVEVNGKVGEDDCRIRLWPSLMFALDSEEFRRFVETAGKRMKVKGTASIDVDEEEGNDEEDGADSAE